jgi:surface antigen
MKKNVAIRVCSGVLLVIVAFTSVGCSAKQVGQTLAVLGAGGAGAALGHGNGGLGLALGLFGLFGALITANEMQKEDQMRANAALETGYAGQVTQWVNPNTGGQFAVTPGQAFYPQQQQPQYAQAQPQSYRPVCRSMEMLADINGKRQTVHSVACRNAWGEWEAQPNGFPNS